MYQHSHFRVDYHSKNCHLVQNCHIRYKNHIESFLMCQNQELLQKIVHWKIHGEEESKEFFG